jgi:pimeloyl-ACP methyl ester carboxylesterase
MIGWARATREHSMAAHLARIGAPTLLVWGEEDRITPLAAARVFEAGLPDARLVTIPRCGHAPMLEAPEEFERRVAPFLAALEASGRLPWPGAAAAL